MSGERLGKGGQDPSARLDVVSVYGFEHVRILERSRRAPRLVIHRHTATLEFGPGRPVQDDQFIRIDRRLYAFV